MICEKGFTLLELMVTVAIIAVTATLAFPTFTDYIEKDRARRASRTVLGALNGARMHALKNNIQTVAAFNSESITVLEVGGDTVKTWTLPTKTGMVYDTLPGGIVKYEASGMLEKEYIKSLPSGDLYPAKVRTGNGHLQFSIGVSISGISRII